MQVEQRVSQRAREAAAEFCKWTEPLTSEAILRGECDNSKYVQAFARFEASLPPSALVDAQGRVIMASVKLGAWMSAALDDPNVCAEMKADIQEWFSAGEPVAGWTAAIATPSVLAGSTSNDCLLVAEAVRERCAGVADMHDHRGDIGQAIRSLDLSGVGVDKHHLVKPVIEA